MRLPHAFHKLQHKATHSGSKAFPVTFWPFHLALHTPCSAAATHQAACGSISNNMSVLMKQRCISITAHAGQHSVHWRCKRTQQPTQLPMAACLTMWLHVSSNAASASQKMQHKLQAGCALCSSKCCSVLASAPHSALAAIWGPQPPCFLMQRHHMSLTRLAFASRHACNTP